MAGPGISTKNAEETKKNRKIPNMLVLGIFRVLGHLQAGAFSTLSIPLEFSLAPTTKQCENNASRMNAGNSKGILQPPKALGKE